MKRQRTSVPPSILEVIKNEECAWSEHATDSRFRLGLEWADVIEVARTATSRKRAKDKQRSGQYVNAIIGRDRRGRKMYMAGKVISYEGKRHWYVITIHEAD